jgi:hypothetical protein
MPTGKDDARPSLMGVAPADSQRTVAEFFAALPWEPVKLDPKTMSAEEFLAALTQHDSHR